jgi:cytochrome c-type biogenesis protein CcmH/NrfF
VFDEEGTSILWMYPWTVLVCGLPLVWRRVARESRPLLWVAERCVDPVRPI